MASQELLSIDKEDGQPPDDALRVGSVSSPTLHGGRSSRSTGDALSVSRGRGGCIPAAAQRERCRGRCNSAPRTAPAPGAVLGAELQRPRQLLGHLGEEKAQICCDEELETSFTYIDENVNLRLASSPAGTGCNGLHNKATKCNGDSSCLVEALPADLSLMMSEDDLLSSSAGDGSGSSSVDYGFISAVTFLVTGISLVVISYAVPRDVAVVDRESDVSAREMERLEMESARVGAHLDRCVIAGLCLLTLGGVVLSTLLMVSMWKGELYRRKLLAYSKRSTKLYGSMNLKPRPCSPTQSLAHVPLEDEIEETLT